jgi:hypothetical protein
MIRVGDHFFTPLHLLHKTVCLVNGTMITLEVVPRISKVGAKLKVSDFFSPRDFIRNFFLKTGNRDEKIGFYGDCF